MSDVRFNLPCPFCGDKKIDPGRPDREGSAGYCCVEYAESDSPELAEPRAFVQKGLTRMAARAVLKWPRLRTKAGRERAAKDSQGWSESQQKDFRFVIREIAKRYP